MGIFSNFKKKDTFEKSDTIEFTKEELSLIAGMPLAQGDKFNELMRKKSIYEHTSGYVQGIALHFITAKNFPLAEKLTALAESKALSASDLHFCYNLWIDLLYKQRDNPAKLNLCIEYCKKDIELYPAFNKENRLEFGDKSILHIPSFERLAIIYEKSGDIENAIRVNELALSYKNIAKHDSYQKRIDKLKK